MRRAIVVSSLLFLLVVAAGGGVAVTGAPAGPIAPAAALAPAPAPGAASAATLAPARAPGAASAAALAPAPAPGAASAATLAPAPAPGAAAAATPTNTTAGQVSVAGTVTFANGTPAAGVRVVVGPHDRLSGASTAELRTLAAEDPAGIAVLETDGEGRFAGTLTDQSVTAESVVAVTGDRVSAVRRLAGRESVTLVLHDRRPLRFESTAPVGEPGERVVVSFSLSNTDDEPIERLRLKLGALPQGWNLAGARSPAARFHPDNRTFVWASVAPGETAEAEARIFISLAAEPGPHRFQLFAGSATRPVYAGDLTLEVRFPTDRPDDGGIGGTGVGAPGLGPLAAVLALLGTGFLATRRPQGP